MPNDISKVTILNELKKAMEGGVPPSVDDLEKKIGQSRGTVYNLLQDLVKQGFVIPPPKKISRGYRISRQGLDFLNQSNMGIKNPIDNVFRR